MAPSSKQYDAVVVGAGIAGASIAAELVDAGLAVLIAEAEAQPGYHATGRSVAFWSESYGGPLVLPLTRASLAALERPDPDFAERSFLSARGAVFVGLPEHAPLRDALLDEFGGGDPFDACDADAMRAAIPGLRPEWTVGLSEPGTRDIDVAALHAAWLGAFRRGGGMVRTGCAVTGARQDGGGWQVDLSSGETVAAGLLVNAAGAWADGLARCAGVAPIGIAPLLRTVAQLRVDPPAPDAMPLVMALDGSFYFKPVGGGRIWLTPHDEKPAQPGDVAPDEIDVAVAIARMEGVVDWRVEAVERRWAGLRSFAPDRLPVYGFDIAAPGFFWFAGQGGFGIQTAPAAAGLARHLIVGDVEPPAGVDSALYGPARFA